MKYFFTRSFLRNIKKLEKRFPSLREDVFLSLSRFSLDTSVAIGKGMYKMRVAARDLKKGKSGGMRMYVYIQNLIGKVCLYRILYICCKRPGAR